MTIIASADFSGTVLDTSISGYTLDNALGGTGTRSIITNDVAALQGDGAGALKAASAQAWSNFLPGIQDGTCRYSFDPDGGTSAIRLTGRKGANSGATTFYGLRLAPGHTSLDVYRFDDPGGAVLVASQSLTAPATPIIFEGVWNGENITGRIIRQSDSVVLATVSHTFSSGYTGTYWDFGFSDSGNTGKFDNLIFDDSVGGDTTAPTLTLPTLDAVNSTTLDAGFTSDEAGFSWTVLTLAAQADPNEAQIRAGQDALGMAAVDSSLNTAMISGVNTRTLSGATAGVAYKHHTVSQDAAGSPNVSNIVSSASETTPVPPQKATVTLYQADGTTPAASITGLQWAWWDDATPDLSLAADISGTGASTDASGVFDVTLTGTVLTLGQTGTLLIYKTDGTAESTATLAFCGPLATVN